jgi:uncharacterized protein (TIGR02246 family)
MRLSHLAQTVLLTLLVVAASCQREAHDPSRSEPLSQTPYQVDSVAISRVLSQWVDAYRRGDADALARLHTEDAVMLPDDAIAFSGREAILAWYKEMFEGRPPAEEGEDRQVESSWADDEIQVGGDWGFYRGTYRFAWKTPAGETREVRGKDITILRRQSDGSWKIAREMWNGDGPARSRGE